MIDRALQNALNSIAREEFRDLADYDYISARVSFRLNLREQFYWSGLQAVEKYFKAILLFNGQSSLRLNHRLRSAYERIKQNTGIRLTLQQSQLVFLDTLEEFGNNRYRTSYTQILGDELPKLDQLIWAIRRYAHSTRFEIDSVDKTEWYLQNLLPPKPADVPTSNQISGGELEKILARECGDLLRQELVWCNCYYGKPENATPLPPRRHSSSHLPVYEREWFKNGKNDDGRNLREMVEEYVRL